MIRLEDIESHSIHLNDLFFAKEENAGNPLSTEDKAQVITMKKEASALLWKYQNLYFPMNHGLEDVFSLIKSWNRPVSTIAESRKWLEQRPIPLSGKVFVPIHPDLAFIMTWKMVIKYYRSVLKLNRQLVWDLSLDWCLYYYEDGENMQWSFYQNRINKNNKER